jgi:uncharacterized protein (DUF608 family)
VARRALDKQFARDVWPAVETYLKDIAATDTDGDGLPNNAGVDQSYDQFPLFGTSAYVGLQYVGAVMGAARMARMIGLPERASVLSDKAEQALATLEKQLWNGEYYDLSFDRKAGKGNAGCMADQLCGDWFVRQADGAGLVPDNRARRALKAVFKYCMRDGEYLANCDWPRGGKVRIRRETSDQANCPWSGVEFAVAAEMMLVGLRREGLSLLRGVYERYERFGMRYNHVECGTHYYRAMSSWAPYLALTGFAWDALKGLFTLEATKSKGRFIWCTPSAWGHVTTNAAGRGCEISVARGTLRLKALQLKGLSAAKKLRVKLDGRAAAATSDTSRGTALITLTRPARMVAGSRLTVLA